MIAPELLNDVPLFAEVPATELSHGSIMRVASGVGEGSMAIAFIHQYLSEQQREAEPRNPRRGTARPVGTRAGARVS